jgi:hypothetical protein
MPREQYVFRGCVLLLIISISIGFGFIYVIDLG